MCASRKALAAGLGALALLAVGCGAPSETTPTACLNGPRPYERALEQAPANARLPGGVPISACLAENQKAGDLTRVGQALVLNATRLNVTAREESSEAAALQAGYLVGAAERGAEDTGGIHADLVRRVTAAAHFSRPDLPLSPPLERAYERGLAAGRAQG